MKYAKIIPLARWLDVKIPSKWYRRIVGGLEIVCGIALTFIPHRKLYINHDIVFTQCPLIPLSSGRTKQLANWILLSLMIAAISLHWAVDDKLERSAPALVSLMLTCRLVVEWQIERQDKAEAAKASAKAPSVGSTHSNIPAKLAKND